MRLVRFGAFEANFTTGELRKHGIRLKLQEQPFQVLKLLLLRPGELVTREEIRQRLWPSGTFVDFDNGLNAAINRLREALGDSAESPGLIETLPRRGYRFIGALHEHAASGGQSLLPAYPRAKVQEVPVGARHAAASAREAKSVAVLYFESSGGSKEDEYFRDGITEDIITELSKISELWVLTRSAVVAFRDKPTTASEVGRQLNAAYVLEGSLRRAGSQLRLTARLVHTDTERSVWAERYDRKLEDVFAIQDEIAQSIAKALKVMLSDEEKRAIAKTPTADIQAYDYYLRGRQHFHRHNGFDFARQMFARATIIDPGYARAYAGEADCCSFLYMYFEPLEADLKEADAASRRAVELDPELPEAHASRGLVNLLKKRYGEAETEFEAATRLNPKLFEAYYFRGRTSFSQGKLEEAAHWLEEASRVNSEDHMAPAILRMVYTALGRKADALTMSSRVVQLLERYLQINPADANALLRGAQCLVALGHKERALQWMQGVQNIDPDEPVVLYNVACTYAMVGEPERAMEYLEKMPPRGEWFKGWAEHDPDLDSLRNDPRFQALLKGA